MEQVKQVSVNDLVVLDFKSTQLSGDVRAWQETAAVPFAESCASQVLYGSAEDFEEFPFNGKHVNRMHGARAYEFLLSLLAGMESPRFGEDHIRNQFFVGWKTFLAAHNHKAKSLRTLVSQLKNDSQLVFHGITEHALPHRHEIAARDLSGQKKGDDILVVGSLNRHRSALSLFTQGIINVSKSKQNGNSNFIAVTHPDSETLREMLDISMRTLQSSVTRTNIFFVPFTDIGQLFDSRDAVYIDIPMAQDADIDNLIIEVWKARTRRDNTITHLRGSPENKGSSIEPWLDPELDSYISPEMIRAEMARRGAHNRDVFDRTKKALVLCAEMRAANQTPTTLLFENHPELIMPSSNVSSTVTVLDGPE